MDFVDCILIGIAILLVVIWIGIFIDTRGYDDDDSYWFVGNGKNTIKKRKDQLWIIWAGHGIAILVTVIIIGIDIRRR